MILLSTGCGRLLFGESGDDADADAGVDAVPAKTPAPIHHYKLQGSLVDKAGGPDLVGLGGGFHPDLGYMFAANQGLKLVGAMPVDAYTIDLRFRFHEIGGCNPGGGHYCKLLDFKNLDLDEGLYALDEKLHFVISATATPVFVESLPVFSSDVEATVTLTRDKDGTTIAYVNRDRKFSFVDTTAMAKFTRADQIALFAVDDQATTPREASSGSIREIKIWDVALSPAEIAGL